MKLILQLLAALAIALVLGVGSALLVLRIAGIGGGVAVGPWTTSLVTGSVDADPYTRARVAIGGLLALSRKETIYFTAGRDDDGDTLQRRCTYRVTGTDPAARWWSITAYAADHYLIPNTHDRYSYGGGTVAREADGSFAISVGPDEADGNWIPTGSEGGAFTLTLRLYNPDDKAAADPAGLLLPKIAKEACPS